MWSLIFFSWMCGVNTAFESDLERELAGSKLGGRAFHRTLLRVMARNGKTPGLYVGERGYILRTRETEDSRLLWVNRGGFVIDDLYLIWHEGKEVRVTMLPKPKEDGWQVYSRGFLRGEELIFCAAAYAGGNWSRPCIRVFQNVNGTWQLKQNIYAWNLEARSNPSFAQRRGKTDFSVATGQVRVYPSNVSAPHVGPLLTFDIRFERISGAFRRTLYRRVETPLAALDDLAGLRKVGERAAFDAIVPNQFRERVWLALADPDRLTVSTNSNVVDDNSRVLRFNGLEVSFHKRGKRWLLNNVRTL